MDDPASDVLSSFSEKEWNSALQRAPVAARAVAMVLHYAEANQKKPLSHIRPLALYRVQDFMVIDEVTKKNLELTQSLFEQGKRGSLFWLLDETVTLMGSRTLKQWLNYPLVDIQEIASRLEGVSELKEKSIERKRTSISGDRAVVGAWFDDDKATNAGSVYLFERNGSTWTQTVELTASDAEAADFLGYHVSIDGDYVLAGAYNEGGTGAAYVFVTPEPSSLCLLALAGVTFIRRRCTP